jgi:hypothetical protein
MALLSRLALIPRAQSWQSLLSIAFFNVFIPRFRRHYDIIPAATIQIMALASVIPALCDIHLPISGTERRRLRYSIPGFRLDGERRGIEMQRPHLQNFLVRTPGPEPKFRQNTVSVWCLLQSIASCNISAPSAGKNWLEFIPNNHENSSYKLSRYEVQPFVASVYERPNSSPHWHSGIPLLCQTCYQQPLARVLDSKR